MRSHVMVYNRRDQAFPVDCHTTYLGLLAMTTLCSSLTCRAGREQPSAMCGWMDLDVL